MRARPITTNTRRTPLQVRRSHLRNGPTHPTVRGEGRAVLPLQIPLKISVGHRDEGRSILERHRRALRDTVHHAMRRLRALTMEDYVAPVRPNGALDDEKKNVFILRLCYILKWLSEVSCSTPQYFRIA